MGFKVDFSELEKLEKEMKITAQEFDDFLRDFLTEMALRVVAKTKPRTPVDTGALRNGWDMGSIKGGGKEISIEIFNPMEYATEIEYGHRIVRGGIEVGYYNGRFMLKTSIDEIDKEMPERYKNEFRKFCIMKGLI